MRFRNNADAEKIEAQMAPMIDVVFQLLIFFMLTLKIVEPEGDFNINMPIGAPTEKRTDIQLPEIKVRLIAGADGQLKSLEFNGGPLGNNAEAFTRLNNRILKAIGHAGNPLTKEIEVEIDADYDLNYENIIKAVGACTGRLGENGRLIRYVEKIKFAPPRRTAEAGA